MLRPFQTLLRYGYNSGQFRKYAPLYPLETEPKKLKSQFKEGDRPEYLYDANIKFEEEYKPYRTIYSNTLLISVCLLFAYMTIRYERIRKLQGKKTVH